MSRHAGRPLKFYTVYDNRTDMPIVVAGTAKECAERMKMSVNTFYSLKSHVAKGRDKKWTILTYTGDDINADYELCPPEEKEGTEMEERTILQEMAIEDGKSPEVVPALTRDELLVINEELESALSIAEEKIGEGKELKKSMESLKEDYSKVIGENFDLQHKAWKLEDEVKQLKAAVLKMSLQIYAPKEE